MRAERLGRASLSSPPPCVQHPGLCVRTFCVRVLGNGMDGRQSNQAGLSRRRTKEGGLTGGTFEGKSSLRLRSQLHLEPSISGG